MIIGNIKNISEYRKLSKGIDKAVEFILNAPDDLAEGKYEIDGSDVYASVICKETKSLDDVKYEAHNKYLDLQYVMDGSEVMGYAPVDILTAQTEYNSEKDIYFLKGEGSLINVNKGDFYIVYPFDAHAPGYGKTPGKFKKIIVKIKL